MCLAVLLAGQVSGGKAGISGALAYPVNIHPCMCSSHSACGVAVDARLASIVCFRGFVGIGAVVFATCSISPHGSFHDCVVVSRRVRFHHADRFAHAHRGGRFCAALDLTV